MSRRLGVWLLACVVAGCVAVAQGTVSLRFSGEILAAGVCSTVTSGVIRCSVPEGSSGSLVLVATATPVRTVQIAAVSLPAGWPTVRAASGWGTATAQYAFTLPPGSAGQRVEIVFQAWADGTAPVELRTILDITAPSAAACANQPPAAGSPPIGSGPTLHWSAGRPISWDDFWAAPPPHPARQGAAGIGMSLLYTVEYAATRDPAAGTWRAKAASLVVTNAMERDRSWVVPGYTTPAVLNHEQRHFDLNEVYRRALEAALANTVGVGLTAQVAGDDFLTKAEAIFQRVQVRNSEAQAWYDRETDHGRDAARQAEWDKRIAAWLLDPRLAPQP